MASNTCGSASLRKKPTGSHDSESAHRGYIQVLVRPLERRISRPTFTFDFSWAALLGFLFLLSCRANSFSAAWTRALTDAGLALCAVAVAHFWHTVNHRCVLTPGCLHLLFFCGIAGEVLACSVPGFLVPSLVHAITVTGGAALTALQPPVSCRTIAMFIGCRFLLAEYLVFAPTVVRIVINYVAGVGGALTAKYVEVLLTRHPPAMTSEGRLVAVRRRRTSNSTSLHFIYKTRRTSLPTLGANRSQQASVSQGTTSTVDVALIVEAHGLVTDMLADPQLPPHVVGGLRALAALLTPPNHVPVHPRPRVGGASVALPDFNSGSDTEEIPYTGEKPSTLSKRFRRNLPPSLLRRMSASTWTTTTSATGLPTLEPEPSRKRSTSFRHSAEFAGTQVLSPGTSSPATAGGSTSPLSGPTSPSGFPVSPRSQTATSPSSGSSKGRSSRSHSTTSIPVIPLSRRNSRDRKTVCSLHPLTSADIQALHEAHAHAQHPKVDALDQDGGDGDTETTEDEEIGGVLQPLPPLPCIRRVNIITSDYESSNESPSSSDNNDATLGNDDLSASRECRPKLPKSLAVQTCASSGEVNRCMFCGGRTKHGVSVDLARTPQLADPDDITPTVPEIHELEAIEEGPGLSVRGCKYDLDGMLTDPLLSRITEWDYPIFDLQEQAKDRILSQTCYRVFHEVGLFDAFKIPVQEFLNYFHDLENGYRDKPYHNRMHAADVVHGVYYLTSQPIPGFSQIASDVTDSPLHKSLESSALYGSSVHRPSFAAEVSYGVMGANYPALELMALYTAAAMHDYDHPGRTNAFLVHTYAPQAILYNDRSVLENHHAAAAWSLLLTKLENNWLCHLDKAEFKRFRFLVIECILATDLKRHFEILAEFNAKSNDEDAPGLDWMSETDRLLAMEMCIKLADINGPCKRHDIHVQWTHRIAEEFYEQGDEEATLGLVVSPFMDRKNPQLAKLQESFINHLVAPLCNAYGEAALLPGLWVEGSDSGDEVAVLDTEPGDLSDGKDTEDELVDSDESTPSASRCRNSRLLERRKIVCLQTQHLQENYDFWVGILKKEHEQNTVNSGAKPEEDIGAITKVSSDEERKQDGYGDMNVCSPAEEMETIEEEDGSQRSLHQATDDC